MEEASRNISPLRSYAQREGDSYDRYVCLRDVTIADQKIIKKRCYFFAVTYNLLITIIFCGDFANLNCEFYWVH